MPAFIHQNATVNPPAMPNPLGVVPIPTAAQLYASLPPAIHWNLFRILNEGVRHKHNLYGYFDAALNEIFPVSQRFQVKSLFH